MPLANFDIGDDVIDSRDIIERIELLESDPERDEVGDAELHLLQAVADEGADYAYDWEYGETLILDSFFEDYARELVEECGYFQQDASPSTYFGGSTQRIDWDAWPYRCIDWAKVAEELKMDYMTITVGRFTYWIRSV